MNAWERGGVSLIDLPELARAAEISGQHPIRCAYVMREVLDSARRIDLAGVYAVDAWDVGYGLSLPAKTVQEILRAFEDVGWLREGQGIVDDWPGWRVKASFSLAFD